MNYNLEIIQNDCKLLYSKIDSRKLKNKTVLITGANGLIGSFIADYFNYLNINHDYDIKIYLTSYSDSKQAERIQHLIGLKNIHYFKWDASNKIDTSNLPKNLEYVFFCSGYGQPTKFTKDNIKTSFINTVGVNSILEFLNESSNSTNLLFLSTSEIYGDPDENNIPTKESYNGNYSITNNRASYITSKRLGEIICNEYAKNNNINIKIARVGLVYGPGTLKNDGRVLQDFIFKAMNHNQIMLLDDGSSLRNYLYLTDGAEILLNLILNDSTKETTYNVGGDSEPITIYQLANKIGDIIGCTVITNKNNENDISKNSPKNVYLSMEKYKNIFPNYGNSIIKLDIGLRNVIQWYNFLKEQY